MSCDVNEDQDKKLFSIISEALTELCSERPDDPKDFLAKKLLDIIGEDPYSISREKKPGEEENEYDISNQKIYSRFLKFRENYKIVKTLCTNTLLVEDLRNNNTLKAATIVDKKTGNEKEKYLSKEQLEHYASLDHENLSKIEKIIETTDCIYFIVDYCPGLDIINFLYENVDKVTEELIRKIIYQIISGIAYLHERDFFYTYLDNLKVLVYNPSMDPNEIQIKISDTVNNVCKFTRDSLTDVPKGLVGKNYVPEFKDGKYSYKSNIWSIGYISYILLCGNSPMIISQKNNTPFSLDNIYYPEELNEVKINLLKRMLKVNPEDRAEASDLLNDPYFKVPIEEIENKITQIEEEVEVPIEEPEKNGDANNLESQPNNEEVVNTNPNAPGASNPSNVNTVTNKEITKTNESKNSKSLKDEMLKNQNTQSNVQNTQNNQNPVQKTEGEQPQEGTEPNQEGEQPIETNKTKFEKRIIIKGKEFDVHVLVENMSKELFVLFLSKQLRNVLNYQKKMEQNRVKYERLFKLRNDGNGFMDTLTLWKKYIYLFQSYDRDQYFRVRSLKEDDVGHHDGKTNIAEFIKLLDQCKEEFTYKKLKFIFNFFDFEKNGYVPMSIFQNLFIRTDVCIQELKKKIMDKYKHVITFYHFYGEATGTYIEKDKIEGSDDLVFPKEEEVKEETKEEVKEEIKQEDK